MTNFMANATSPLPSRLWRICAVFDMWGALSASSWIGNRSGQTESMSSAGQNGRIWSYRYHCRSALSPRGGITAGRSLTCGVHDAFSNSCFTSVESHCSLVKTHPGEAHSILKWCNFLIPNIFFILGAKKSVQSYM